MADYYTLLTNAGIAYETACKAAGTPIKLTQMSVGDGGAGGVYNPDATATALRREVWRGNLNALFQDSANPSWLLAEVTIPPEVGGWYVREAGLWTDTGILYAIIKYPESFKPVLASSGSGKEFYIRAIFETSNAALVTLSIDDTIVKATRAWVASYVAEELAKLDNKQSARVTTTANIVLVGAQTIDGVAVVAGDRVLVKNQTQPRENGIYVAAVGAWVRAKDANNSANVTPNMTVAIEVGATQADTIWQLVTDGSIVVGTTALTFKEITDGFARLFSPSFTGNPTAPTPARFDSSKSIATTEHVKQRGVEFSSFTTNSSSQVLSAVHVGGLHSFSDAAQLTATLPPTAGVAQAATITLACAGPGGLRIVAAGVDVVYTSTGVAGPLVLALGDTAEFIRLEGQWRLVGGTAALPFAAVMAGPSFSTRPQFDDTKALATTEFVRRALGNCKGFVYVSANTVLTAAQVGSYVSSNVGTGSVNVGLPLLSSVAPGSMFVISHSSTAMASFAVTVSGSDALVFEGLADTAAPYVMAVGETLTVVSTGVVWKVVASNGARFLKHGGGFAAGVGVQGYQKLPSGTVIQRGTGTTVNGTGTVSFPVAFPTACRQVLVTESAATGWSTSNFTVYGAGAKTLLGATIRSMNWSGSSWTGTTGNFDYIAIGE